MADFIEDYVNSRHKLQYTDGPYANSLSEGLSVDIDAPYIIDTDKPMKPIMASSEAAEKDGSLSEDELLDVSTPAGKQWAKSSRAIYNRWHGGSEGMMPLDTPSMAQTDVSQPIDPATSPDVSGERLRADPTFRDVTLPREAYGNGIKRPETDQDFARWGVEFMGQFNYNMTKMAVDYAKLRGMDEQTALNFYNLMYTYDQLPMFTWNGTKRMFKGLATDPTTYAGLGTLGLSFVGRAGSKQMTKKGFQETLKRKIQNPYVIAAIEGGAYSGLDDALRQGVEIEAKVREGIDPLQTAGAAAVGAAAGTGLVGAVDAAPTVARAVGDRLSQRGEMPTVGALGGNIGDEIEKAKKLFDQAKIRRESTTGRYVGGPAGLDTPQKLAALRKKVAGLTQEGAPGRFWYERSGKAILNAVGGDKVEAEKIAQAIAITSSGTPVSSNFDYALQAYLQHKAGQPITTGRFPVAMSKRLTDMFDGTPWEGRKTNSFYVNLMREIDPTREQPVTVDLWMLRAFGYGTDNPTDQQYTFIENEVNKIADQLGWEPQQVQAAIWVKAKADDEGISVDKAKFDYADALEKNKMQISWESIPGRTSGHMLEMFDAPYEVQQQYHVDISKAFLDDNGNDIVAQRLGIPTPGDFEAPGYFEGKVSPGTQTELAVPRQFKGPKYGAVEPAALELVNAYAAVRGILMKQDGVGYHRPFYNPAKKDANGIQIDIGRKFTEEETAQFAQILSKLSGHSEYNPIGAPGGVRIINFDYLEFDNKAFIKLVDQALDELEIENVEATVKYFASQNGYAVNDWSVSKNGEGYISQLRGEGRSDIQRKVRDIITELAPRIDAIDTDYQINHGFTGNPEINSEFRKQINSEQVTQEVAKDTKTE